MTDQQAKARIEAFLQTRNTMTLATCDRNRPWATSVFYCHDADLNLYCISDPKTRHSQDIELNGLVSVTVNEDVPDWGGIQGLQIDGRGSLVSADDRPRVEKIYLDKFLDLKSLFQAARDGDGLKIYQRFQKSAFYCVTPKWIRFIDNSRGFGFKEELVLD